MTQTWDGSCIVGEAEVVQTILKYMWTAQASVWEWWLPVLWNRRFILHATPTSPLVLMDLRQRLSTDAEWHSLLSTALRKWTPVCLRPLRSQTLRPVCVWFSLDLEYIFLLIQVYVTMLDVNCQGSESIFFPFTRLLLFFGIVVLLCLVIFNAHIEFKINQSICFLSYWKVIDFDSTLISITCMIQTVIDPSKC